MKIQKSIYAIGLFFCLLLSKSGMGQVVTIPVTDAALGNANSLDVALTKAITQANAGKHVILSLNAPGLCQITAQLPTISITGGSITFDKNPAATVEQGLQYVSSSIIAGIFVSGNSSNTSVAIKHLTFKDFVSNSAILLYQNVHNVDVSFCLFDNNDYSVLLYNTFDNILIQSNQFNLREGNFVAIDYENDVNTNVSSNKVQIKLNTIHNLEIDQNGFGIVFNADADYDQTTFEIENNAFYNLGFGINLSNDTDPSFNFPTENVTINGNSMNGDEFGFNIENPLRAWHIENNSFNDFGSNDRFIDINLRSDHPLEDFNGISFIESNNLGYTTRNTGNIWSGSAFLSFDISGNFGDGVHLVGLNLVNPVNVSSGVNTNIRECKMKKVGATVPINLSGTGNDNIESAAISTASLNGSALTVNYLLNGSKHIQANADFFVDFYKANANGDLVDYIGNQTIATVTGLPYTANLTLPSGVILDPSDQLAVTVTGHHVWTDVDNPITSQVAYFTGITQECCSDASFTTSSPCANVPIDFQASCSNIQSTYSWNFGDGTTGEGFYTSHTYTSPGVYSVRLDIVFSGGEAGNCDATKIISLPVELCNEVGCVNCIGSFAPTPGDYMISVWVKETNHATPVTNYDNTGVKVSFVGSSTVYGPFYPDSKTDAIIDGWQRIERKFSVPVSATDIIIDMQNDNTGSIDSYFDDIRIHPFDASMKSYVYDPVTLRLVAELDENNYATTYEYDKEGKMIRVKKETEKGFMTIKENRSANKKRTP